MAADGMSDRYSTKPINRSYSAEVHFWAVTIALIVAFGNSAKAQLIPDGSLGAENSVVTPNLTIDGTPSDRIDGGAIRGNNLFHSFQEFNVGEGRALYFTNPIGIENILTRVTGGNTSQIFGTLGVSGNANLFLINPNGIIFGPNSRLDLRGSFIASTADSLKFADGTLFGAALEQNSTLLTVNLPIGLQYGSVGRNGAIVNRSRATNNDEIVGLQVDSGRTLALVGGEVTLEGGYLKAAGGRIEIGGVSGESLVNLTPTDRGFVLGYDRAQNLANITLNQEASIDANDDGKRSGNIQLQGNTIALTDKSNIVANNILGSQEIGGISIAARRLQLQEGSQISASTLGTGQGGDLTIRASESVELVGARSDISPGSKLFVIAGFAPSSLITRTEGSGNAANLTIETRQLIVERGASISASTLGDGKGGTIAIQASDSVTLSGPSPIASLGTGLFAQAISGKGSGGSLLVETHTLTIQNIANISASTFSAGDAGDVTIRASEIILTRRPDLPNGGALSVQSLRGSTGQGGNLTIDTDRLTINGGSQISVGARTGAAGRGGSLNVIARDAVEVSGKSANGQLSSALFGRGEGSGGAGDVRIETGRLIVADGAEITVSGTGTGSAGNLEILADSIALQNNGSISATSAAGDRGNITLQARQVQLLDRSNISTNATGNATGGNISIDTDTLVALTNSNITANADRSFGGRVSITSQGIFGIQFRDREDPGTSDITASSSLGSQFSGTVTIQTPEINPNQGLITVPENFIDISSSIARTCQAEGSQFVVTGRGGLPPTPFDYLSGNTPWLDLRDPEKAAAAGGQGRAFTFREIHRSRSPQQQLSQPETPVVEAKGWQISDRGEVILTSQPPAIAPYSSWWKQPDCGGGV